MGDKDHLGAMLDELLRLGDLKADWNGYGSDPPGPAAFRNAKTVIEVLCSMDFPLPKFIPDADGGVGIVFDDGDRYADLGCDNDGDMVVGLSDRKNDPEVWEVVGGREGIREALCRIKVFMESSNHSIQEAVRKAVEDEREACAAILDAEAQRIEELDDEEKQEVYDDGPDAYDDPFEVEASAYRFGAAMIRDRGRDESNSTEAQ